MNAKNSSFSCVGDFIHHKSCRGINKLYKMFSIYKNEVELLDNFQNIIEKIAKDSIDIKGQFNVGFSGKNVSLIYYKLD